jgi:hypothetical protein
MFGFEFSEEFCGGTNSPPFQIFQALAYTLDSICLCCDVQQSLITLCILHHRCSFAVDCEHNRPLASLDLLHKIARPAPEGSKGLNVLSDVQHDKSVAPSKVLVEKTLATLNCHPEHREGSAASPRQQAKTTRGSAVRGAQRSVFGTLSQLQYCSGSCRSQVTSGGLSLRFPPNETNPPQRENGPDGIRTRICDLDRVPCFRLHYGPTSSLQSRKPQTQGNRSQNS